MSLPTSFDPRKADSAYGSFPPFGRWSATVPDQARWDRYAEQLRRNASDQLLGRAREIAKRVAAVDTGAIEGLYEVDRGFTFTVAFQIANWEAALQQKGAKARSLIEAQLAAYDYVLDFATQRTPIAEAWIRTLHEAICSGQETYLAYTELGPQEQQLTRGAYKILPNHVLKADGTVHSYAPVDLVPAEMKRLVDELRSSGFQQAHPVIQSAYAHYALVVIHPFADGNGRVARALASVYTYRAVSVPLLILAEQKGQYIDSLSAADSGLFQPFTDFISARALDSMQFVHETVMAASVPQPSEALAAFKSIYLTKGGLTHAEVDAAGYALMDAIGIEINEQVNVLRTGELVIGTTQSNSNIAPVNNEYRTPVTKGPRVLVINLHSSPPAGADLQRQLTLEVPRDSGREDDIVVRDITTGQSLSVRVTELVPRMAGSVQLRTKIFVQAFLGKAISDLTAAARVVLKSHGY